MTEISASITKSSYDPNWVNNGSLGLILATGAKHTSLSKRHYF